MSGYLGAGWKVEIPQIVDSQDMHVLTQDSATVQVVNTIPFLNPLRALDTNRDGSVSPLDALIIVNRLNTSGPGPLSPPLSPPTSVAGHTEIFYIDTNGDLSVAPVDVIRVVNFLHDRTNSTEGEGGPDVAIANYAVMLLGSANSPSPNFRGRIDQARELIDSGASVTVVHESVLRSNATTGAATTHEGVLRKRARDESYPVALDELLKSHDWHLWDTLFA